METIISLIFIVDSKNLENIFQISNPQFKKPLELTCIILKNCSTFYNIFFSVSMRNALEIHPVFWHITQTNEFVNNKWTIGEMVITIDLPAVAVPNVEHN